ncbi:hypothetical protein SNE40_003574 [Patella caerulea]|uniref:ETFB lysine methyltransferase n=1 Tax=Patella caerulea TaxID=87958 RepID=A0AAN8Q5F9_PATCE
MKEIYCKFKSTRDDVAALIEQNTEISTDHMTPEIKLRLITPNCHLWHSNGDDSPFLEPFWAFYWPGGQALTRYILDNGERFNGKTIVDIGSGCGATAIACKLVGARHVIANDIDSVAAESIKLNSELNDVTLFITTQNLIGQSSAKCDIILLGDMFYDEQFANIISDWLKKSMTKSSTVFIGDPGRHSFQNHPMREQLKKLACYELPKSCKLQNNGLISSSVWEMSI